MPKICNVSPEVIDVYTAIDLDRTILKSTKLFYGYIVPALQRTYGYDDKFIERVLAEEERLRGRAFDFVAYVNKLACECQLPTIAIDEVVSEIVNQVRNTDGSIEQKFIEAIMQKGALELIGLLSSRPREAWGIMTSGGVQTQSLKLRILNEIIEASYQVSYPEEIIATEHKATTIMNQWYDRPRALFRIPPAVSTSTTPRMAKKVRLLDDKLINTTIPAELQNLAEGRLETYLVQAAEKLEFDGLSLVDVIKIINK